MNLGGVLARRPHLGPEKGVTCYSVAGHKTGLPGVNFAIENATVLKDDVVGGIVVETANVMLQLDIPSAQRVAMNIFGCAEAAISDMTVFHLLTEGVGLDFKKAGRLLIELRERRQGTRDVVFPQ
ncbi:MAG: hypothetical protein ACRD3G_12090 [Vicinamibacterales bacterium]